MRATLRTLTLCLLIAFAPEFAGAQYQPDTQYPAPVPARRPVPAAPVPARRPVPAAPVPAPATSGAASAQQYLHVGRAGARWP